MNRLRHPEFLLEKDLSSWSNVTVQGREIQLECAVHSIQFASRGLLVTCGVESPILKAWSTESSTPVYQLEHEHPIRCFAVHPHLPIVLASDIHTLKTWSLDGGSLVNNLMTWDWFYRGAMALAISPKGDWGSIANQSDLCSWGTSLGLQRLVNELNCTRDSEIHGLQPWWFQPFVESLAFSHDGCWLAAGGHCDSWAAIWDLNNPNRQSRHIKFEQESKHPIDPEQVRERYLENVRENRGSTHVAFQPSTSLMAVTNRSIVEIWEPKSLLLSGRLVGHRSFVNSLAFHPSGAWLLTGSDDGTVRVWNMRLFRCEYTYDWGIGDILTVAICPRSGRCAAGGSSGTVVLWDDPRLAIA